MGAAEARAESARRTAGAESKRLAAARRRAADADKSVELLQGSLRRHLDVSGAGGDDSDPGSIVSGSSAPSSPNRRRPSEAGSTARLSGSSALTPRRHDRELREMEQALGLLASEAADTSVGGQAPLPPPSPQHQRQRGRLREGGGGGRMSRAPTPQQQQQQQQQQQLQQQQQQQQRASQQHPSAFEAIREQAAPLAGSNVGSGSGGWWAGDGAEAQATTDVMLVHEALASVHEAERLQRQAEDVKQQQQQQQQHADSLQQGGAGRRESIGGAFVAPALTVAVPLADHTDDDRSWVGTPASEQNNGNMRSGPGEEKPVSNQVQ